MGDRDDRRDRRDRTIEAVLVRGERRLAARTEPDAEPRAMEGSVKALGSGVIRGGAVVDEQQRAEPLASV